jgi:hypothetical protein
MNPPGAEAAARRDAPDGEACEGAGAYAVASLAAEEGRMMPEQGTSARAGWMARKQRMRNFG